MRLGRYIHLLIAVGTGLLLGAAFLDLLPEAVTLGAVSGVSTTRVLCWTALSFLLFHAIDTAIGRLAGDRGNPGSHRHIARRVGAGMLVFHSFRDGMAIGAAYAASHAAGYAVACGIAAHDLGDGMNTVILTTRDGKPGRLGYGFLLADALAPALGGAITLWWGVSTRGSVVLLVLAAGFFLQMAVDDFLPEIRSRSGPKAYLIPALLAGASIIYAANVLLRLRT